MTVYSLYPPIALATVVNSFLFALLWRGHKAEIRVGEPPWWLSALILLYVGSIAAFFYMVDEQSGLVGPRIFVAALGGEAFGGAVTFAILRAVYFTRGMPKAEIVAAYLVAISAVVLLAWGTVALKS